MASNKSRDAGCCSVNFVTYVLYIFNVVFVLAGLAVLGVAIWTVVDKHEYVSLLTTVTYPLAAYLLIVAGILVLIATFIGCFGVQREDRCLLLVYTFLLLLIFLLEAKVGIIAYFYEEQVEKELTLNLNNTFLTSYNVDEERTRAIDNMQKEYRCCGAVRFEDWRYSTWLKDRPDIHNKVPDSCCKTVTLGCGIRDHPSNIHYNGCVYQLSSDMKIHLIILGAVGLGFCVIQIFGIVFAIILYLKLKDVLG